MSVVNKTPRKLRVTVTLEEFGSSEYPGKESSNELLGGEEAAAKRKSADNFVERLQDLFWLIVRFFSG